MDKEKVKDDSNNFSYIISNHIGVSGYKIYWVHDVDNTEFKCRTAIALFGSFNMPTKYLDKTSPFEPDFQDNYIEGKGKTKEEAYSNMMEEMQSTADSLWVE